MPLVRSWATTLFFTLALATSRAHDITGHFTNDWVARIAGGDRDADVLAAELGYKNLGTLKGFNNTYLLRKIDHPNRSKRDASHLTRRLSDDHRVEWAEQQVAQKRVKRGYIEFFPEFIDMAARDQNLRFNDDLWPDQWYLHDTRSDPKLPRLDMGSVPVWNMGYTGKGVVVTIIDDGLEWNHTDIIDNYDPKASWDINDMDPDPFPSYDLSNTNNHGTRCAGEVAMTANNGKCGVGVAYNAKVGGIRMLDGIISDSTESMSLTHGVGHVDILSSSWGPTDDGATVDGPKRLALEALHIGITKGRGGLGTIFVWASGNGGSRGDNCNCDGYTNSVFTLSVGSASQHGDFPWYGERCASTMAAAYSSGAYSDQKIATTDLHNECTLHHTGTSAAAPLAAGVIALVLEANPKLTWRDVQHLTVWTAEWSLLRHNKGWRANALGLAYNSRFGFGLVNAERMVKTALQWTSVPEKAVCSDVQVQQRLPQSISSRSHKEVEVEISTKGCEESDDQVKYLEHVELVIDVDYSYRGALDVYLTSPSGTVSMLLSRREKDYSSFGFKNWTFMSVHFWGENPSGTWKVLIRDLAGKKNCNGSVNSLGLNLHGTKEMPKHMAERSNRRSQHYRMMDVLDNIPEFEEEALLQSEEDDDAKDEEEKYVNNKIDEDRTDFGWTDFFGKTSNLKLPKTFFNYFFG